MYTRKEIFAGRRTRLDERLTTVIPIERQTASQPLEGPLEGRLLHSGNSMGCTTTQRREYVLVAAQQRNIERDIYIYIEWQLSTNDFVHWYPPDAEGICGLPRRFLHLLVPRLPPLTVGRRRVRGAPQFVHCLPPSDSFLAVVVRFGPEHRWPAIPTHVTRIYVASLPFIILLLPLLLLLLLLVLLLDCIIITAIASITMLLHRLQRFKRVRMRPRSPPSSSLRGRGSGGVQADNCRLLFRLLLLAPPSRRSVSLLLGSPSRAAVLRGSSTRRRGDTRLRTGAQGKHPTQLLHRQALQLHLL
eukprot:GHVU01137956.1.p1 GENE.GHVU01137956.1~~GHVU01137956.1.p1  ORF type:complete len:302 (+),score=44.73 GHVU01137956.1:315-1220(+)